MKRIISILTVAGVVAAMLVAGALPVFAQGQQPGPTTITATGVLVGPVEDNNPDPTPEFRLTDEATGTTFELSSGFVDLGAFAGQRVTIEGVRVPGINPLAFNVTSIQSAPPGAVTGGIGAGGATGLPSTGGADLSITAFTGALLLLLVGGLLTRRLTR